MKTLHGRKTLWHEKGQGDAREKFKRTNLRSEGKAAAKAIAHGSLALTLGMDHPEEGHGGTIAVQMACEKN